MHGIQLAAKVYGSALMALVRPEAEPAVQIVLLPSDGLERARPRITLSNFFAYPGPKMEALMRSAAFRATEHKYDI